MRALIAVLAVVAVVAVVLILVFVVDVFGGDDRPHVSDDLRELVLEESQLPSGYERQDDVAEGCEGVTAPGMTGCESAEFLREREGDEEDETLASLAASFTDAQAAAAFLQQGREQFRDTAYCTLEGEPVAASDIDLTELPSPGLGDESLGLELRCRATGNELVVGAYAWRVDNVVQIVIGPETGVSIEDLAEKIEARK